MSERTEIFRVADGTPEPDTTFYTITAEDVGLFEIRTTVGTINVWDIEGRNKRDETVLPDEVGTRLYGLKNLGFSGENFYWSTSPRHRLNRETA